LISTVVTPSARRRCSRRRAAVSSSPAGAARVARPGDAAAAPRDLLVGRAQQALLELVRPIAREHEMRVRVDQAGRDPAAPDVDDLLRLVPRQRRHGAEPGDAPAFDGERRIPDRAIGRAGFGHGGEVGVDEQAVEGGGHE
jgi:hypothetical protein